MAQFTKCEACRTGFFYSNEKSVDIKNYPIARIITFDNNNEGQEKIQHPNKRLFYLLQKIEKSFTKHCKYSNVFELVVNDVTGQELEYPCSDHAKDVYMRTSLATIYKIGCDSLQN